MGAKEKRVLDEAELARLLKAQDGVVSRRQVLDLGGTPVDIRRKRRRRDWVSVHDGVYVNHTGPPTRRQRQWAAVLACWPSALHREDSLDAHGLTRDRAVRSADEPIRVMVDASRTLTPPAGVRVERGQDSDGWTMANRRPPRAKLDFALLKVAADRDEPGAIALLADGCRQGLTKPTRLVSTLTKLTRLRGRSRLLEVLDDVATGTHSVLEHRYLERVERAHGLPSGERQLRVTEQDHVVYRDVRYPEQKTLVELDGPFGHADAEDRWADLDRDLAAAVHDEITIRLGWGQILQPCRVAVAMGAILRARGWPETARACGPTCPLADDVGSGPTSDPDPTGMPRGA